MYNIFYKQKDCGEFIKKKNYITAMYEYYIDTY